MRALVTTLTKKAKGGVARRDDSVETDALRFGRGADCEVHLVDPRVQLHHAQIVFRPGGYFLEAFGQADFEASGQRTQAHRLSAGEKVQLGPYEIVIVGSSDGYDIALTVELVRPLGDDLAMLQARSRIALGGRGLGKRGWSWLLFLLVVAVFLAAPILAFTMKTPSPRGFDPGAAPHGLLATADQLWLSGPISGSHKFFGVACESCHQKAFVQTEDQACLACHATIQHHADAKRFAFASFEAQACQSCHKEHTGNVAIVLRSDGFCTDCHAGLKQTAPAAGLDDATDFRRHHPPLRATVPVDATGKIERVALTGRLRPADQIGKAAEQSNLKFPHAKHLGEKGVRHPDKGMVKLDCGGCHVADPGKIGFLPIRMEAQCIECHQLRFEPKALHRQLPHGKPAEALAVLGDFYAAMALQGGVDDADAPAIVRRRPGTPLKTEAEKQEALAWARAKTAEIAERSFGRSLCGSCHTVEKKGEEWQVAKVHLTDRFMPKGKFPHGRHASMPCGDCHGAAQSELASDLLLPGVENCQSCHGSEKAADRIPSACIDCHDFHRPDLPPMRPARQAAALGR